MLPLLPVFLLRVVKGKSVEREFEEEEEERSKRKRRGRRERGGGREQQGASWQTKKMIRGRASSTPFSSLSELSSISFQLSGIEVDLL